MATQDAPGRGSHVALRTFSRKCIRGRGLQSKCVSGQRPLVGAVMCIFCWNFPRVDPPDMLNRSVFAGGWHRWGLPLPRSLAIC